MEYKKENTSYHIKAKCGNIEDLYQLYLVNNMYVVEEFDETTRFFDNIAEAIDTIYYCPNFCAYSRNSGKGHCDYEFIDIMDYFKYKKLLENEEYKYHYKFECGKVILTESFYTKAHCTKCKKYEDLTLITKEEYEELNARQKNETLYRS